ncbi:MAG: hypothetical protein NT029_08105 [Armatimonadetes bacterium]|nr:hypothetical protein [Armatimonadota bacterium]
MAPLICAGSVYKVDEHNHRPAHYWIVLSDPSPLDGRFLTVSLTDWETNPHVNDCWQTGYRVCPELALAKPSALMMTKTCFWLPTNLTGAEYVGQATEQALKRARCSMYWFMRFISEKPIKSLLSDYRAEWSDACGDPAPHASVAPTRP